MNKTVNINLAGIFFHIDEDAYLKLQRYLEAIKHSFTDSQGRDEIIADIEARIAELFTEYVQSSKKVIGIKEVDDVIAVMGQPEDYLVDDEIFDDEPDTDFHKKSRTTYTGSKKLFRDTDNSYIGGVASGLGHYFGIDAIWLRLLWVLLAFGSGGTFIFIYILFWILVPEAVTTADKLNMTGEPVNISNIEKKIKDGFDNVTQNVSDAVKSMDLPKQGSRIKSSSKTFFDTLGEIIIFILKVFGKLIGLMLIAIGAFSLIALVVALFSVGVADIIQVPGMDYLAATSAAQIPLWLMSLMMFFTIAIPFFFIFYLGLRILVRNLKSIGQIAKFSLLGLWLLCVIGMVILGLKQASEYGNNASVQQIQNLNTTANDTLYLSMAQNDNYNRQFKKQRSSLSAVYDEQDNKLLYMTDVHLTLKSTEDSIVSLQVNKSSRGNSYQNAKNRAENIHYNYKTSGHYLELDNYLTTAFENQYRDQEVEITLYLPKGMVLHAKDGVSELYKKSYHRSYSNEEEVSRPITSHQILIDGLEQHFLQILEHEIRCLDCPEDSEVKEINKPTHKFEIDKQGIHIRNDTNAIEINEQGINSSSENVKVKIDKDGIKITTDNQ